MKLLIKTMTLGAIILSTECFGAAAGGRMIDIRVSGCTMSTSGIPLVAKITVPAADATVEQLAPQITKAAMTLGCRKGGTIKLTPHGDYDEVPFTDEELSMQGGTIRRGKNSVIDVVYKNPA